MRRLGRGLESLIQDIEAPVIGAVTKINIEYIKPNRYQPRRIFDPEKLNELAESIRENGLIQPIVVGKNSDTEYELIAGERRYEACKKVGLTEIPVYIKEVTDKERLVLAIIENVQRENLSPIEEAKAYQRLIDEFELSHQEIAKIMSKDRATISNSIRLLKLSEELQNKLENKELTTGHARAILMVAEDLQDKFAAELIEKQYTVRQSEDEARHFNDSSEKPKSVYVKKVYEKSYLKNIEKELTASFGLAVKIKERKNAAGEIQIAFDDKEALERIVMYLKESKSLQEFSGTIKNDG